MLKQYYEIKQKYPNELLFFRLGDFYELFGDDAKEAAAILDIVLTARNKGRENETAMCGVPYHAAENYLSKLLKAGKRVAICEQLSDPNLPGIVKREVVQVVTPGTTLVKGTLENKANNYIAGLFYKKGFWGGALADLSTGELQVAETADLNLLANELFRFNISEVIITQKLFNNEDYQEFISRLNNPHIHQPEFTGSGSEFLRNCFQVKNLQVFGLENMESGVEAGALLFDYLQQTQKNDLKHFKKIKRYVFEDFMALDEATIRNLEIFSSVSGQFSGSLLSVIDKTVTGAGGRMLRRWLTLPLINKKDIEQRHEAVGFFKENTDLIKKTTKLLKRFNDLERLVGRLGCGRGNARDLAILRQSLKLIPKLKDNLDQENIVCLLNGFKNNLPDLQELVDFLEMSVVEDPPTMINEGGLIADGYNQELDELRKISRGGKDWLAKLQAEEIKRSGISSLKIKYNKVFGYYIEISKTNLSQVPENYIRKQTLVNAERFITPELKEYEEKILRAEEKIFDLEHKIFEQIVEKTTKYFSQILKAADIVARLDVLVSLAFLAVEKDYCCPEITDNGEINIKKGRHPVIEVVQNKRFVPNDLQMASQKNQFILLTGPNMSGKSSYLRQAALIVLLAQIGSFVPAESAKLSVVDRVFTRVGASDNLSQGVSTFMAEMLEAGNILNNATDKSLIILDELGRGTSTYDGLSLAWAIIGYIHEKIKAKTLFATHYHELIKAVDELPRAENYCVAVSENEKGVVFLHKIVKGAASESYGLEVARMAGLPDNLINQAEEILKSLEGKKKINIDLSEKEIQKTLPLKSLDKQEKQVLEEIKQLNPEDLTPLQALNLLFKLKKRVAKE